MICAITDGWLCPARCKCIPVIIRLVAMLCFCACLLSLQNMQDLQAARTALEAEVQSLHDEQRRMTLVVQGLELSKQGLQRRVQW
jgi:hypothetical protein